MVTTRFEQPLRARGAHVVVADHLEHRRAREAGQQADAEGREDERGQDQVLERLPEQARVEVDERVDRVEAGDVRRRVDAGVEPARAGQPVEAVEEDVEGDEGDPERGIEMPASDADAQHVVGGLVAPQRREDAERDAEDRRDQHRVERELGGRRDELAEVVRDRVMRERRLAEVAVQHVPEVDDVPLRQRLVEAVVRFERGDGGRVAGRLLAEVRGDGIRRHELREQERHGRDADR